MQLTAMHAASGAGKAGRHETENCLTLKSLRLVSVSPLVWSRAFLIFRLVSPSRFIVST